MSASPQSALPLFAADVLDGLSSSDKSIPSRYLYDEIGLGLFQTMSKLPAFGAARAENRLLRRHLAEIAETIPQVGVVAELAGSFSEGTTQLIRKAFGSERYFPKEAIFETLTGKNPEVWLTEVSRHLARRQGNKPALVVLQGSALGNLDRMWLKAFLDGFRKLLQPGDCFLFSADLVKDIDQMLSAYDDGFGVVSAFNRNVLARINRELGGRFRGSDFQHRARWNAFTRRVDLELIALRKMDVYISALGRRFPFQEQEAIHTESFYKFTELELESLAGVAGFRFLKSWVDIEWSFAEVVWTV